MKQAFFLAITALTLNSFAASVQKNFFEAAQASDIEQVKKLIPEVNVNDKVNGVSTLQVVAQQAIPIEDNWLQLKYERLHKSPVPDASIIEKQEAQKLLTYIEIAQLLLDNGAQREGLKLWNRKLEDYPLTIAQFGTHLDYLANNQDSDRPKFIEEFNKLKYFFINGTIRKKN